MTRRKLAGAVLILAACDSAMPTAATRDPGAPPDANVLVVEATGAVSLIVSAPGQLVVVEHSDGRTDRAWFEAHMVAGTNGGATMMDGAILVVSAADGPMPQSSPDAETLRIRLERVSVGLDGVIRFAGTASLDDANQKGAPFDVTGTATQQTGGGDDLIWDILGSNVHVTIQARAVVRSLTG
jgi:hypothetical protein